MIYVDKDYNLSNCLICAHKPDGVCNCPKLRVLVDDKNLSYKDRTFLIENLKYKKYENNVQRYYNDYHYKYMFLMPKLIEKYKKCVIFEICPYIKETMSYFYES